MWLGRMLEGMLIFRALECECTKYIGRVSIENQTFNVTVAYTPMSGHTRALTMDVVKLSYREVPWQYIIERILVKNRISANSRIAARNSLMFVAQIITMLCYSLLISCSLQAWHGIDAYILASALIDALSRIVKRASVGRRPWWSINTSIRASMASSYMKMASLLPTVSLGSVHQDMLYGANPSINHFLNMRYQSLHVPALTSRTHLKWIRTMRNLAIDIVSPDQPVPCQQCLSMIMHNFTDLYHFDQFKHLITLLSKTILVWQPWTLEYPSPDITRSPLVCHTIDQWALTMASHIQHHHRQVLEDIPQHPVEVPHQKYTMGTQRRMTAIHSNLPLNTVILVSMVITVLLKAWRNLHHSSSHKSPNIFNNISLHKSSSGIRMHNIRTQFQSSPTQTRIRIQACMILGRLRWKLLTILSYNYLLLALRVYRPLRPTSILAS